MLRWLQHLTRLDLKPQQPLPPARRVVLAGAVAAAASVVACVLLSELGKAALSPPASFDKFNPPGYVVLTLLGVVGATVGWAILVRLTSQPRWCLQVAAVLVTVVLLLPDVAILPSNPTSDVVVLMVEHLVIAVITTGALLRVSAPGRDRSPSMPVASRS